jgi:hypothetical protein
MRRTLSILGAAFLNLAGCGGGNGDVPVAAVTTSEPVNGVDPGAATFAVFGAAAVGNIDAFVTQVIVLASSDPAICQAVGDDLFGYLGQVNAGLVNGTTVFIALTKIDDFPTAGQSFQGNGQNARVDLAFDAGDGTAPQALTLNAGDGTFSVEAFIEGQSFTGSASGTLVTDESSGAAQAINVDLSAELNNVPHCQILSDAIVQGAFFQGF